MSAAVNPIQVGAKVVYHGSVSEAHGCYFVADICTCDACDDACDFAAWNRIPHTPRYLLAADPDGPAVLRHVRRTNFTACAATAPPSGGA
ncbi:hypothetical protein HNP84_002608 [Thermocatellispora tengchongensis]|uniref:Uncharacterized protein n=1 Tax=Thermocatellispora tengchongensis TaxID=1073253 RepID=A0A840P6N8_9ACTN|nr:hypothetical protein [Thermocatellispora tengchongensis]